jgi:hypothetical protein
MNLSEIESWSRLSKKLSKLMFNIKLILFHKSCNPGWPQNYLCFHPKTSWVGKVHAGKYTMIFVKNIFYLT